VSTQPNPDLHQLNAGQHAVSEAMQAIRNIIAKHHRKSLEGSHKPLERCGYADAQAVKDDIILMRTRMAREGRR
jgi:hypothetical protein